MSLIRLAGDATQEAAAEIGAAGEIIVFLRYFSRLPDFRQRSKVVYPFDEVLLLCLCLRC